MATRNPQAVHQDVILTQISVGYSNADFVGDALAPVVNVSKQSDKYWVQNRREGWSAFDDLRGPGSRANELPPMVRSQDTYFAQEHALVGFVHDEETDNEDAPLDAMSDETIRVTDSIQMGREQAMASMATTAANYNASHTVTLAGTDQWSDYANSDPKDDVKTGREVVFAAIQKVPNVAIMGRQVYTQLEDHPDIIERIKYTQRGIPTADIIAEWLGVGRLIVASGMKDTANVGASAPTLSFIWGKDVVLAYVPPTAGRKTAAFMYEFNWRYPDGRVQRVERWYDIDHKSTKIRVSRRYDLKFIAVDSSNLAIGGYLIKNAVA